MSDIEKCFQNKDFLNIIDAVKLTSNKYNYSILKFNISMNKLSFFHAFAYFKTPTFFISPKVIFGVSDHSYDTIIL